jgi:nucleotide-binding universal stress UspA family protein
MFKTVIWATDGSEAADQALPFAKDLVRGASRQLVVLHNKERLVGGRTAGFPLYADEDEREAKICDQVDEACAEGLDATFRLTSGFAGHSGDTISNAARELDADVIVVGTRGHGPVMGALVGSVTQRLLHTAPCPVLAVPMNAAARRSRRERERVAAGR